MPTPPKPRPSLNDLTGIPAPVLHRMNDLAVSLADITEQTKHLEAARGYNDSRGVRHPGLADELEALLIIYDLTDGVSIQRPGHTLTAALRPGSRTWIDEGLLLEHGIDPQVIVACRRTSAWSAVTVTKRKTGEASDE